MGALSAPCQLKPVIPNSYLSLVLAVFPFAVYLTDIASILERESDHTLINLMRKRLLRSFYL